MSDNSFHRIKSIAQKEIVEFARDWRTIMAIIVIPLLMFPLLFILFPVLLQSEAAELDALELVITIQSDDFPNELANNLTANGMNLTFEPLPDVEFLSDPGVEIERVRNGSIDALLRFDSSNETWSYGILHLSTSER